MPRVGGWPAGGGERASPVALQGHGGRHRGVRRGRAQSAPALAPKVPERGAREEGGGRREEGGGRKEERGRREEGGRREERGGRREGGRRASRGGPQGRAACQGALAFRPRHLRLSNAPHPPPPLHSRLLQSAALASPRRALGAFPAAPPGRRSLAALLSLRLSAISWCAVGVSLDLGRICARLRGGGLSVFASSPPPPTRVGRRTFASHGGRAGCHGLHDCDRGRGCR